MFTSKEQELVNVHKNVIFARFVFEMKLILDRQSTMEFLRTTYEQIEGISPKKNVRLDEWFLENFEPDEDGWIQKHRWSH